MKRLFIAVKIYPSEKLQSVISECQNIFKKNTIKFTAPENYHITLAFLGDTGSDKENEIAKMLRDLLESQKSFEIKVKGIGLFRSLDDPKVITAGITLNDTLSGLNSMILSGLKELGVRIEDKPFRPHLTIGRIKSDVPLDTLSRLVEKYQNESFQIESVNEIILYESKLYQEGPVYTPAFVIQLNGNNTKD